MRVKAKGDLFLTDERVPSAESFQGLKVDSLPVSATNKS
ncbi:hypothetical protein [Klebsiella phage vB_KpnS-VAC35]|uniref:Uncharacterized protein n=1 Tax=Klebsiella phage vB_KpnS-VAC35 TaxID=2866696 RepID=A0AAE8YDP6_9CAUD|nr:hypothetical protein [Klebsiella phage vB_KpnS-VAC35]WOZ53631.1 hypothetical protein pKMKP103_CDS0182 [Klebsiella phage pKMKP103]CAK6597998.1 hypothetical protein K30LAMBDA22_LOCUS74 [Klebsiella phage vB_Kpn_K30lambda2.2]